MEDLFELLYMELPNTWPCDFNRNIEKHLKTLCVCVCVRVIIYMWWYMIQQCVMLSLKTSFLFSFVGSNVGTSVFSIHRNATVWENPNVRWSEIELVYSFIAIGLWMSTHTLIYFFMDGCRQWWLFILFPDRSLTHFASYQRTLQRGHLMPLCHSQQGQGLFTPYNVCHVNDARSLQLLI